MPRRQPHPTQQRGGREPSAEARTHGLVLRVVGDGLLSTFPLPPDGEIVVGRGGAAGIRIDDKSISRRHAILRVGPRLTIEDLGSANGTRVGERRALPGEEIEIAPGDVVDLGSVMVVVQPAHAAPRPRRIWPHGYFEGRLEEECARSQRSGAPFAVARIRVDADHSPSGAEEVVGAALRAADVLAVYGPNEWEILLCDVDRAAAEHVVSTLQRRLKDGGIRASLGLACHPADGRTADALVARAGAHLVGAAAPRGRWSEGVDRVVLRGLDRMVDRIGAGSACVLLVGEPGVGKETIARRIHARSSRSALPFLRLRARTLPDEPLSRDLLPADGTVLFDEVSEAPAAVQAAMVRMLGARRASPRVIATTCRDLEAEASRGRFLPELARALVSRSLLVPPLRERAGEIEPLARAMIDDLARRSERPAPHLSDEAVGLLLRYRWPGNVRELGNVMERAVLLCTDDSIGIQHLPVDKMVAALAARALAAAWAPIVEEDTYVGGIGPPPESGSRTGAGGWLADLDGPTTSRRR